MNESISEGTSGLRLDVDAGMARYAVAMQDGRIEVRLDGEVDLAATAAHESVLAGVEQLLHADAAPVVVMMGGVTFCDSSGLALLVRLKYLADSADVGLVLQDAPDMMKGLLDATGLRDELDVEHEL
jgi:anti-anti-sigma factor